MKQSSQFVLSQLSQENRKLLRPLLEKSWSETYTRELGEQTATTMIATLSSNDIGGLIPNNDESVFVATQNDAIRGCAVSAARHGVTYLWGFYVLSEFQRCGYWAEPFDTFGVARFTNQVPHLLSRQVL